ncbi:hypothetical protein BJY24_004665 [Nocardia transvalensis]|uniref:Uncharacterized protein n=1 Tax=Nocardia transvalensis TaxID=37333 RepID=A0A7W9UJR8_9NOCA|nr:hypothetical protein [Nocardia transvalensis]MBB5915753.1 hypothetical protein [Nocardia transvalensis]
MATATVLAYKQIPADVIEPVMQLINWLLWVVLLFCLAWMIISAGRLWSAMRDDMAVNDASHGIVMSLIGAIVASSASAIALTVLPT